MGTVQGLDRHGYGAIARAGAEAQPGRSITVEPRPFEGSERVVLHPHAERLARRFGVRDDLAALIYEEARLADVEPAIAFGMIAQESGFDPAAVGRQGERGLMQIKPSTARDYDARVTPGALHDPELNVRPYCGTLRGRSNIGDQPGLMSYHMGRALEHELADGVLPRDRTSIACRRVRIHCPIGVARSRYWQRHRRSG
jgi:hypothetical protein